MIFSKKKKKNYKNYSVLKKNMLLNYEKSFPDGISGKKKILPVNARDKTLDSWV